MEGHYLPCDTCGTEAIFVCHSKLCTKCGNSKHLEFYCSTDCIEKAREKITEKRKEKRRRYAETKEVKKLE